MSVRWKVLCRWLDQSFSTQSHNQKHGCWIQNQTKYHLSSSSKPRCQSLLSDSRQMSLETRLASAKLQKSLNASTFNLCDCFDVDSRGGVQEKSVCVVASGNYQSNMAPTSALCALCIQSQCVITMSLHSYIVITVFWLVLSPSAAQVISSYTWLMLKIWRDTN